MPSDEEVVVVVESATTIDDVTGPSFVRVGVGEGVVIGVRTGIRAVVGTVETVGSVGSGVKWGGMPESSLAVSAAARFGRATWLEVRWSSRAI